jgi:hypothetical protein
MGRSSCTRSRPAPDDHCSRSDSYGRIMMTGIEIGIGIANRRTDGADDGYARAWTGGDGKKERERGKGKRRRAEHDVTEEDRPGRGCTGVLEKVCGCVFLCFFIVIEATMIERSRVSAVSRHRARTPREVLRGSALCDKQGETEGTERPHPRDWPASRGYEVQELKHATGASGRCIRACA